MYESVKSYFYTTDFFNFLTWALSFSHQDYFNTQIPPPWALSTVFRAPQLWNGQTTNNVYRVPEEKIMFVHFSCN